MQDQNRQTEQSWGARINTGSFRLTGGCPAWATREQREKWEEYGLILWDHGAHQIALLSARQALQLLDYLGTNDDWKSQGITLGEPATKLVVGDPAREPEAVLINQIELNVTQSQELFDLLENNEAALRELGEKEEKDESKTLYRAYCMLLGEQVWNRLIEFYQDEPEETLRAAQELVAIRMGTPTDEGV